MKTYFISDLHLGHANVIRFDGRPWETVEEMDAGIIRRWNSKVRGEDHVYVIGDFAYRNRTPISDYVQQLNGYIHLIRGNHDVRSVTYESCFREVMDYKDMTIVEEGVKCRMILSHYFIPFYNGARHMAFMLHGHTHRDGKEQRLEEELKAKLDSDISITVTDITEQTIPEDYKGKKLHRCWKIVRA